MVRLYWLGEVLDSPPIATYSAIFIQIGQLFRMISTDKLFRTHRQTHTCQAKNQFSWRFSASSQEMCLAQLRIFDGIPILHSFYEHGRKTGKDIYEVQPHSDAVWEQEDFSMITQGRIFIVSQ